MAKSRKQIQADYRERNREKLRTASRELKRRQAAAMTVEEKEQRRIKWRERYKNGYNRHYQQYRYGVTPEQYDELLTKQQGGCAICGDTPKSLCVDHCHNTGRIRGLLCRRCNSAIGMMEDDPMLIGAALRYLLWT